MNVSVINGIKLTNTYNVNKNISKQNSLPQYKQSNDISNVCYKPLSFGRRQAEHKSWGAYVNPETKETTFKILTFPDTKRVTVTVEKQDENKTKKRYELENKGNGVFETEDAIPADEIGHGDKYFYTLYKGNGEIDRVKDPYSFRQEKLLGSSTIYDHSLYQWNDDKWYSHNKNRISRLANKENGLKSVSEATIYEFNTATLTREGTFESAKKAIDKIAKQGFNAIEIMPAENTYSFNWGYDGVDKFAPSEHLGGPDKLKELIDYSHSKGLNVIMDMVPNHLGPDGAALHKTGPFISKNNCWGSAFNYEGKDSKYVRDYIVNAALNWLDNYHCDGLRLDMTKFMESDIAMKQIAAEVNYHKPDAFLIAEDARNNIGQNPDGSFSVNYYEPHDKRVTAPLSDGESGYGMPEAVHTKAIERFDYMVDNPPQSFMEPLGYDSEWDFNFMHALKDKIYGDPNLDRFENACCNTQSRVKYVMSHDEIGNMEGTRFIPKIMSKKLNLKDNIALDQNDLKRATEFSNLKGCSFEDAKNTVQIQKAEFSAEKLATMFLTNKLSGYKTADAFREKVLIPLGFRHDTKLTYKDIKNAFDESFARNKMSMASTYSLPGPIMVFQGDESADLTPFRFFRQFQHAKKEPNLYIEKGYDTGKAGLFESKLGGIKYSEFGKTYTEGFNKLTCDLNKLTDENPAISKGRLIVENNVKHSLSDLLATHARDDESGNEIFTIMNFKNTAYPSDNIGEYNIKFPAGKWVQILNTDDKKYNGSGKYSNKNIITSDGRNNTSVKLAAQSTYMFQRVE